MTDNEDSANTTTSALQFQFERNASYAIQLSLNQHRPLLMLIQDQSEESTSWILDHFQESLSHFSTDLLNTKFINLDMVHNSNDFQLFLQIFPQFSNVQVPCVVIVYSGKIIDIIDSKVSPHEFDSRLKEADNTLRNVDGAVTSSHQQQQQPQQQHNQHIPATDTATGNTVQQSQNQNQNQNQQQNPQTRQQSSPVSPASHSSTPTPSSSQHGTPTPTSTPPPVSNNDNKSNKARRYSSLKEQAAELAAKKYRENLVKQQRQDQQERERILQLLKADREERKGREQDEKSGFNNATEIQTPAKPVHENIHNKKLEDSSDYMLQIKLFDGHSFRAKFDKTETLYAVREYVWAHYTEYQQLPFFFFKTIDRVTFTDTDEDKTLGQLNLNRATLIMKPLDPYAKSSGLEKKTEVNKTTAGSSFSWLKSKFVGYLWGSDEHHPGQGTGSPSSTTATSATTPSVQRNSASPPVQTGSSASSSSIHQRPYHDYVDESEPESVYHSPEFRARSNSPQPAMAGSSNFNLYGPITGSGHSGSGFNLNNLNQSATNNNSGASSNIANDALLQQQHPPLTNTVSSASTTTSTSTNNSQYGGSTRVKVIHTVEDLNNGSGVNREVYNGNALDLEDNNNKNKKKKTDASSSSSKTTAGTKTKNDTGNTTGSGGSGSSSADVKKQDK